MARFFDRLVAANAGDWRSYTHHPFVERLADGSLPLPAFQRYLVQDYLFLIQFVRAHGLAIYKCDDPVEMRRFAGTLDAILNHEMALHIGFSAEWGLSEAALTEAQEAPATLAYTRFVLDRGLAGDLLSLAVVLAPCIIGYGEIGTRLAGIAAPATPYRRWIDTYAGAEYQDIVARALDALDRLAEKRGGDVRFDALAREFGIASRLEAGFWQMGLAG